MLEGGSKMPKRQAPAEPSKALAVKQLAQRLLPEHDESLRLEMFERQLGRLSADVVQTILLALPAPLPPVAPDAQKPDNDRFPECNLCGETVHIAALHSANAGDRWALAFPFCRQGKALGSPVAVVEIEDPDASARTGQAETSYVVCASCSLRREALRLSGRPL